MKPLHFALIGEKLPHSLSPKIHSIIFELLNLKADYSLLEIPQRELSSFIPKIKNNFQGINVTIPYKKQIIEFLTETDENASLLESVNTVLISEKGLKGFNTDVFGFTKSLERCGVDISGDIAVIGLGGVGFMVATYCFFKSKTLSLAVLPRHLKMAEEFKASLLEKARQKSVKGAEIKIKLTDQLEGGFDLMVNCSPVGMFPNENACPVPENAFHNTKAVFDCIYNPKETVFLKTAKKNGAVCVGGTEMLALQALEAEKIWLNGIVSPQKIDEISKEVIKFSEGLLK